MLFVDPNDPTPLYAQLDRGIRAAIAAGRLKVGDRLPTVRQLAIELKINANTVAKVYAELERAGVLATQRGIGTFVRENPTLIVSTTRRDRERDLRPLVERLLADASAIGISLPEIVAVPQGARSEEYQGEDLICPAAGQVETSNLSQEASKSYHDNPTALHLSAMSIGCEV